MRQALPLWYCLDYETQAKLAPMLAEPDNIPPCQWAEWPSLEFDFKPIPISDTDKEFIKLREIARLMEQAPSRSRGTKGVEIVH